MTEKARQMQRMAHRAGGTILRPLALVAALLNLAAHGGTYFISLLALAVAADRSGGAASVGGGYLYVAMAIGLFGCLAAVVLGIIAIVKSRTAVVAIISSLAVTLAADVLICRDLVTAGRDEPVFFVQLVAIMVLAALTIAVKLAERHGRMVLSTAAVRARVTRASASLIS